MALLVNPIAVPDQDGAEARVNGRKWQERMARLHAWRAETEAIHGGVCHRGHRGH
jgi:hypothetical protein